MPPGFQGMIQNFAIGTELIYSFVIIACCLIIYFGTRELYSLTNYRGIKYFRQAFLFFAIAFFFRSFIKFLILLFNSENLFNIMHPVFAIATTLLFMYFSSLAIFYLFYSIAWKKYNKKWIVYALNLLALIISIVAIASNNILIYLILNLITILCAVILIIYAYSKKSKFKKISQLFIIYLLLLVFWTLNIIDLFIPNFLQPIQLLVYFISIGVFFAILYKVLTKIGSK